jgi:hypothetical protein
MNNKQQIDNPVETGHALSLQCGNEEKNPGHKTGQTYNIKRIKQ